MDVRIQRDKQVVCNCLLIHLSSRDDYEFNTFQINLMMDLSTEKCQINTLTVDEFTLAQCNVQLIF